MTPRHFPACPRLACAAAALAGALMLTVTPAASAAPVTYAFAGSVDSDEADRGWQAFAGQFSFDSAAVDLIPDPNTAAYAHAGAPWGITVSFDGDETVAIDALFNILVSNDLNLGFGPEDQFGALAQDEQGTTSLSLTLWDFAGALFTSDALPLPEGGLALPMFSWSEFRYESGAGTLQGRLQSLVCIAGCGTGTEPPPAIPEPGTWALALAGLGTVGLLQWRRRKPRGGR